MILERDLNFTLSSNQVGGTSNAIDQLSGFFRSLFENSGLVDIVPNILVPKWSNGRVGLEGIAKSLDIFLMADQLCSTLGHYIT